MFSILSNGDKVFYDGEIYTFIDINYISLGHYQRGIKCKIFGEYINDDTNTYNYCINKVNALFDSYNSSKEKFLKIYNEIINDERFICVKEKIKSYYFFLFVYLNKIKEEKEEIKRKRRRITQ